MNDLSKQGNSENTASGQKDDADGRPAMKPDIDLAEAFLGAIRKVRAERPLLFWGGLTGFAATAIMTLIDLARKL
ncbi:MAG: hypothetical protein DI596_00555 [Azospira oryzae]|nr:MAG: hypothetical protein DI596_00555 [Azospira oryzae]PZP82946.1 MAG: hypothetical protein DI593_00555 [Azospira oryzae]